MRSRRVRLRIVGAALLIYGLAGVLIFVLVAVGVARPLERARHLSETIETQRVALADSLDQAETTIRGMSTGVGQVDSSLASAATAIDQAASISHDLATNMYGLSDAMTLSIFGAQPLVGLASGFQTTGQNLDQLGQNITDIGAALDTNRADAVTTAQDLSDLADSVHALVTSVSEGPSVAISPGTLDTVRLVIYAVAAWLVLLAVGCIAAGAYLINLSRRSRASA